MKKNHFFRKLTLLSLFAFAVPFIGVAEQTHLTRNVCLPTNGFNLKQEGGLLNFLRDVCAVGTSGSTVAECNPSATRFTFISSGGGVSVTPDGFVTSDGTTRPGRVFYTIFYEKRITSREEHDGFPFWYCGELDFAPPGTRVRTMSISASISGYFDFFKPLPNVPVDIVGSRCFTDTISLRTNSDFQHFVSEWVVLSGDGLIPRSPTNEWAVSYERPAGADNQFTVKFTVRDESVCATEPGNIAYLTAETVIGTRTIPPTIEVENKCVPIGTTTLTASALNPHNYNFFWSFRTNNGDLLPTTSSDNSVTFDIGRSSGHVMLKAWGICDTVSTEVLINRSLSQTTQIWIDEGINPSCIFRGDTLNFSIYPTLEEHILWDFPQGWEIASVDSNSGTIRLIIGENGYIEARSRACSAFVVRRLVSAQESNVTLTIDGLPCRIPGTAELYSVTGLATADMFIWRFDGNIVGDGEQISFMLPASYRGNFGLDSLRVTAIKCNREFTTAIPIFVQFTEDLLTIENTTCAFVGDEITFTITPEINENITWTFDSENLTFVRAENSKLILRANYSGSFQVSAQNKFCTETSIASTFIEVLDKVVGLEIISDATCFFPKGTYIFEVEEVYNASYKWTAFGETFSTERIATLTIPEIVSETGNVTVTVTLCDRDFSFDYIIVIETPYSEDKGIRTTKNLTCFTVGQLTEFYIEADPTATSYTWIFPAEWGISDITIEAPETRVSVEIGATKGTIKVIGTTCGGTWYRFFEIEHFTPANATDIRLVGRECINSGMEDIVTLEVVGAEGATIFEWEYPAMWRLDETSGNVARFITNGTDHTISVRVGNETCGMSDEVFAKEIEFIEGVGVPITIVQVPVIPGMLYRLVAQPDNLPQGYYEWHRAPVVLGSTPVGIGSFHPVTAMNNANYCVIVSSPQSGGCISKACRFPITPTDIGANTTVVNTTPTAPRVVAPQQIEPQPNVVEVPIVEIVQRSEILETAKPSFRFHPNPANGNIYLQFENPADWVEILDIRGLIVTRQRVTGSSETIIDVSNLRVGTYIVRVFFGDTAVTERLQIIR